MQRWAPVSTPYVGAAAAWTGGLGGVFLATVLFVEFLAPAKWRDMRGKCGSRASLLLGYEMQCLLGNMYLAAAGVSAWFSFAPFAAVGIAAGADSLYADVPYVVTHILCPMIGHLRCDLVLYL
jgi:hypothetical protein